MGVGIAHRGVGIGEGPILRDLFRWYRRRPCGRGGTTVLDRCRSRTRASDAVRYEGQLLGDGGYGSVWSVLGIALRSYRRSRCSASCQHGCAGRAGGVEFGVHPV